MPHAQLKVIGGKHDGKLLPLRDGKFLVGREEDCHLRLYSRSVSRHHCVVMVDELMVRLRALGSTNGSLVNGKRIQSGTQIETNDRVTIGKFDFEVLIAESPKVDRPVESSSGKQLGDTVAFSLEETDSELPDLSNSTLLEIPALPMKLPDPSTTRHK